MGKQSQIVIFSCGCGHRTAILRALPQTANTPQIVNCSNFSDPVRCLISASPRCRSQEQKSRRGR